MVAEDFASSRQTLRSSVDPRSIDQKQVEQAEKLRTRKGVTRTKSVEKSEQLLGFARQGLRKTRKPAKKQEAEWGNDNVQADNTNNGDSNSNNTANQTPKNPWNAQLRKSSQQHLQNLLAWDQKHAKSAGARLYGYNNGNQQTTGGDRGATGGRPSLVRRNSESKFVGLLATIRKNLRHVERQPYEPPVPWREFVTLRKTNFGQDKGPSEKENLVNKMFLRKTPGKLERRHSFPSFPGVQLRKTPRSIQRTGSHDGSCLPIQMQLRKTPVSQKQDNSKGKELPTLRAVPPKEETEIEQEEEVAKNEKEPEPISSSEEEEAGEELTSEPSEPELEEKATEKVLDTPEEIQKEESMKEEQEEDDDTSIRDDNMDESLRQMERLEDQKQRLEQVYARKIQPKEKPVLTAEKARDILMWYARMNQPNKETMKRKVQHLPKGCDITVEDVDALPWICKDRMLDIPKMNQLFLQGGLS